MRTITGSIPEIMLHKKSVSRIHAFASLSAKLSFNIPSYKLSQS